MVATTVEDIPDSPQVQKNDWKIISLIGSAHAGSHFFQLVLPTLFLSLANEFGFSYGQLGLLVSVFFVTSGIGQASSGFIVDRIGPAPVLHFGLACFVLSGVLMGFANGYPVLVLAAFVGGVGNSVFHPVDYSIINHRVSRYRLGHAYSTHGFTGNLGWALTPVYMSALIYLADWRVAAFGAAALLAVILVAVWFGRHLLSGQNMVGRKISAPVDHKGDPASLASKSVAQTFVTLVKQPVLWGAFFFFTCSTMSMSAVQSFTIPMLGQVYGIDKVLAGTALSGYMLASAIGMIAGGFRVGASRRNEMTVAGSLILAGLILVLLASGMLHPWLAIAMVGLGGFCAGIAAPSRDMLVRSVTPKGATGTVYGLVYSGMDVGASIGPVVFGILLDAGFRQGPWIGAAITFVLAAVVALVIGHTVAQRKATGAAPA
ncbi:MAG TPA: MFS transporter [Pusillimonas sp.]|nr:MFS transporter [Pusillimonas sp.]